MSSWFEKHAATLDKALDACARRYSWTAYPESPSSRVHGTELPARGRREFEALLGEPFAIESLPGFDAWVGGEVSPFSREALGIRLSAPRRRHRVRRGRARVAGVARRDGARARRHLPRDARARGRSAGTVRERARDHAHRGAELHHGLRRLRRERARSRPRGAGLRVEGDAGRARKRAVGARIRRARRRRGSRSATASCRAVPPW